MLGVLCIAHTPLLFSVARLPVQSCTFTLIPCARPLRRPFMARMVAQRNSRSFQSTLLGRENVLDDHISALLENFAGDPTFFKKKHGYNVHGQMLGKDGKMIVKVCVFCWESRGKIGKIRQSSAKPAAENVAAVFPGLTRKLQKAPGMPLLIAALSRRTGCITQ